MKKYYRVIRQLPGGPRPGGGEEAAGAAGQLNIYIYIYI